MSSAADRNLLFGILALQNGFVGGKQLIAAMNAWVLEKSKSLGEILLAQKAFGQDELALLNGLVARHLAQHGGDPEKSLEAVNSVESVREELGRMADPEVQATLRHVGQETVAFDPHATLTIGAATSTGSRFRILRPHAKGGLGEVFVALDEELRREVALKQIQPYHADKADSRIRFLLEAEITGGLEHPGIVPVYGLGAYADGRPYYAMRFIRGDSLKDAIERFHARGRPRDSESARLKRTVRSGQPAHSGERTLEFRELLGRFIDVCNAIEYAHSRGVIHRDLKPGNIMLGKYGETLVVDWGLAKSIDRPEAARADSGERTLHPSAASGSTDTLFGSAVGTPHYMSPEQAAGRLDQLGPQSDIYSLGATLYCLLTGQAPLANLSDVGEVLRRVERGDIPPPRELAAQSSSSTFDVPRPLDAICRKAMALKQADRYQSPRALADDLEHWLADEPISAEPEKFSERLARWTRRHRAVAQTAAAALALIAVVAIVAALLVNQERQTAERLAGEKVALADEKAKLADTEKQARRRADEQTQLALKTLDSVVFDIERDLAGVPGAHAVRRKMLDTAIEGLKQVARTLDSAPQADRTLAASHIDLGDTFLALGASSASASEEARRQYQTGLEITTKLAEANPGDNVAQRDLEVAHSSLGNAYLWLGKIPAARDEYTKAMQIGQRLVAADPADVVYQRDLSVSYSRLGDANQRLEGAAAARDAYQKAWEIDDKLARAEPKNSQAQRDLAVNYEKLGAVDLQLGHVAAARAALQKGFDINLKLAQAEPDNAIAQRDLAVAYLGLGDVKQRQGESPAASADYCEAVAICLRLAQSDPNNPQAQADLAGAYVKLGDANLRSGNGSAARDLHQKAHDIRLKLSAADRSDALARRELSLSYDRIGNVNLQLGDTGAAKQAYQKSAEIREKLVSELPADRQAQRDLSTSYQNLGDLNQRTGDLPAARDAYQKSAEINRKLVEADPSNVEVKRDLSVSLNRVGDVSIKLGDVPGGRDAYQKSWEIADKLAEADPTNVAARMDLAYSEGQLATGALQAEDYADAARWLKQSVARFEKLNREGKLVTQTLPPDWLNNFRKQVTTLEIDSQAIDNPDVIASQPPERVAELLGIRGRVLARRGKHLDAAAAAEQLAALDAKNGDNFFHAAEVFALCSARIKPSAPQAELSADEKARQERYASRAVEFLKLANAADSFKDPEDRAELRKDHNLDPLRSRDDFKKLLAEIEAAGQKKPEGK